MKKKLGGLGDPGGEIKNRKWPFGKNGFVKRGIEPIMPFFTAYGMAVTRFCIFCLVELPYGRCYAASISAWVKVLLQLAACTPKRVVKLWFLAAGKHFNLV